MERSKKKKKKKKMMMKMMKKMKKMKKMMKKMMKMMMEEEEEEEMEEEVKEEEMEVVEIIQWKLLPSEIIRDILSRLPFESLVYCRSVCKTWRTLIEDPLFFEIMHNNTTTTTATKSSSSSSSENESNDDDQSLSFIILTRSESGEEPNELLYAEYNNSSSSMIGDNDDDYYYQLRFVKRRCSFNNNNSNIQITRPLKILYSLNYGREQFRNWVLIGSSNGLVCLYQNQGRSSSCRVYYICNPVTGEYLNLISEYSNVTSVSNGFGYDPCTKQYKLVSVHYKGKPHDSLYALYGDVKVYTLGSGRWRDKKKVPFLFPGGVSQPSVLVNGALHWVTRKEEIVSFDLADEEFRLVPSPPVLVLRNGAKLFLEAVALRRKEEEEKELVGKLDKEERLQFSLDQGHPDFQVGVLGGCLCVADDGICVWVMNKYMSKESWTKNFTIDYQALGDHFYKPLSVLRNGALLWHRRLLGYKDYDRRELDCCVYDSPKDSKSGNIIEFHDKRMAPGVCRNIYIVPYIKSFVSLKALGEQDVRYAIDSKEDKKKRRGKKRKRDAPGY